MASLRDIRKRIRSVRNTQKITGAMKLVAAARLRRAQDAILATRPYALELAKTLRHLAKSVSGDDGQAPHPLLEVRPVKKALLVVMTSDRGLCGPFNTGILRRAERFITERRQQFESLEIATIGNKGRDYFRKRKVSTVREFSGVFNALSYRRALEIAEGLSSEFVRRDLDAVFLLYSEFKSAMLQRPVLERILPIVEEELPEDYAAQGIDYIYEPNQQEFLQRIVPRFLATEIWRALLESAASEHGARMTAMESAKKNARELAERLTLRYNRVRQAAITAELMDIVGGAEALAKS